MTYHGFQYDTAYSEMKKYKPTGDNLIELGGLPFTIPTNVDKCGPNYLIYLADTASQDSGEITVTQNLYKTFWT